MFQVRQAIHASTPKLHRRGVTLIELMTVLALLSILGALAAPSFSALAQRYKADLAASQMVASLHLARVEAIKRGGGVIVSRLEDPACPKPESVQDWSCGWRVIADLNGNGRFDAATDAVIQSVHLNDGTAVMRSQTQKGSDVFVVNRWGQLGGVNLGFTFTPPNNRIESTFQVCSATGGRVRKVSWEVACPGR